MGFHAEMPTRWVSRGCLLCWWLWGADASKSGVAQETVQNMAHKVSKTMTEHEARQILGVSEKASWEEVMKV
jgi:hypothetical protein